MRGTTALVVAITSALTLIASDTVAPLGVYSAAERRHWAFQPRANPPLPNFTDPADRRWVKTPSMLHPSATPQRKAYARLPKRIALR